MTLCKVMVNLAAGCAIGAPAAAAPLVVDGLPYELCGDRATGDERPENQRYWYLRVPPYVGYAKGERTTAGGDGSCLVGFPKASSAAAVVSVDGALVELSEVSSKPLKGSTYRSADSQTEVVVRITGGADTCEPNADKCCGSYEYARITIKRRGNSKVVRAARYIGG